MYHLSRITFTSKPFSVSCFHHFIHFVNMFPFVARWLIRKNNYYAYTYARSFRYVFCSSLMRKYKSIQRWIGIHWFLSFRFITLPITVCLRSEDSYQWYWEDISQIFVEVGGTFLGRTIQNFGVLATHVQRDLAYKTVNK